MAELAWKITSARQEKPDRELGAALDVSAIRGLTNAEADRESRSWASYTYS